MNKAGYIALVGVSFFTFFIICKLKKKEDRFEEDRFEEEICNLKNAVDSTVNKLSK